MIFLMTGPLMGGLYLYAILRLVFPIDPRVFQSWVYWAYIYGYGTLSAAAVGGIMAAYGGERLLFRVVISASVLVGVAFCAVMLRNGGFGPNQLVREIPIAMAVHVLAGVSSVTISKLLLRL
jgi:hypothetical protein